MEQKAVETCTRHQGMPLTAKCIACGTPICGACRTERGYFCSDECLSKSKGTVDKKSRQEFEQKAESFDKLIGIAKTVISIFVIAIICIVGWFVWKFFLDPAGKVVWKWKCETVEPISILKHDDSRITLKTGALVISLEPATGRELSRVDNKDVEELSEIVKLCNDGAVMGSDDSIGFVSLDGKLMWKRKMKEEDLGKISAGEDTVLVMTHPHYDENAELPVRKKGEKEEDSVIGWLTALKIDGGEELWRKEIKSSSYISGICAGKSNYVYSTSKMEKDKYVSFLKAADMKTSKEIWQIKLDNVPTFIRIIDGAVIFIADKTMNAISEDGKNKLWSLPVDNIFSEEQIKSTDDILIANNYESMSCVDLKEKKLLWTSKLSVQCEGYEFLDGKIYYVGSYTREAENTEEVKLPPSFEQLKDEGVLPEAAAFSKGKVKYESVLVCLDAKTGKEIWRKEKAHGQLAVGSGKLMIVNDTALLHNITIANGGRGESVLLQVEPSNGKILLDKNNPAGLLKPFIISGKVFVAVEFERSESVGISAMLSMSAKMEKTKYLGLAGFKIK